LVFNAFGPSEHGEGVELWRVLQTLVDYRIVGIEVESSSLRAPLRCRM
jgi:hypothetical protein